VDFILISTGDWDHPYWTNKQHVAATLAEQGHRVLYAESMGLRRPFAVSRDRRRMFQRVVKWLNGLRQVQKNLWVFTPVSIPLQQYAPVRWLNLLLLRLLLRAHSRRLHFREPVFWTYNPLTADLIGTIGDRVSVYHCVDELRAQPGMPARAIEQGETELLRKVDLVFATSTTLRESRKTLNENTHYFPNVVDFDHFHRACTDVFSRPVEFEAMQAPIIAFIGAISTYKVDFSLLFELAESRPDYQIVLIGEVGEGDPLTDTGRLQGLPNLHFLGPRPYQALPQYLQHIDVCVIPSVLNEYTRCMFPMKFFEYLAAGKPVVAVDTGTLTEYTAVCRLTETTAEFIHAVDECLTNPDPARHEQGVQLARQNTYIERTQAMLKLVCQQRSQRQTKELG
jgi:glycosyltransferase involved in cell wall biosynthesis